MLDFERKFSVDKDILPFILKNQTSKKSNCPILPSVRLVGQEKDGSIIIWWVESDVHNRHTTFIGLFDLNDGTSKILLEHSDYLNVVNATLSPRRHFLAFVTCNEEPVSKGNGKLGKDEFYKSLLAEIAPSNRVFDFNLKRNEYIRMQFLYSASSKTEEDLVYQLIVLIHNEGIGLYQIRAFKDEKGGISMFGQPERKVIYNKFIWCQWSNDTRRLYLLKIEKKTQKPCFLTFEFNEQNINEFILEITLDIPVDNARKKVYISKAPYYGIPEAFFNMKVLTKSNGTMCICYQHFQNTEQWSLKKNSEEVHNAKLYIIYSIYMIHHNHVIECRVPHLLRTNDLFQDPNQCKHIYFDWFENYLLVHYPGYFTHLLNVNAEFEPCHHIFHHNCSPPIRSISNNPGNFVSYIDPHNAEDIGRETLFFDCKKQTSYSVSLNKDVLIEMFKDPLSDSTRLCLIHYVTLCKPDTFLAKQFLSILCKDPLSSDMSSVLKEFLISATYSLLTEKIKEKYLKYFSFTNAETFRGYTILSKSDKILCNLQYRYFDKMSLMEMKPYHVDSLWTNLTLKRSERKRTKRFLNNEVVKAMRETPIDEIMGGRLDDDEDKVHQEKTSPSPREGLLKKIGKKAKSAFSSSRSSGTSCEESSTTDQLSKWKDSFLGVPPPFLIDDSFIKIDKCEEFLKNKTTELLHMHLAQFETNELKDVLLKIPNEYIKCQVYQTRLLSHILWSVMTDNERKIDLRINTPCSQEDYNLFLILEKYLQTLLEISYPKPKGFNHHFTILAFKCLQTNLFSQYVDHGVFTITIAFVKKLFAEMKSNDEGCEEMKFYCLSKLCKEEQTECLKRNHDSLSQRLVASKYINDCLYNDEQKLNQLWTPTSDSFNLNHAMDSIEMDQIFCPLANFMKLLKEKDPYLDSGERGLDVKYLVQASTIQNS